MLTIRLTRRGKKNQPFFRVVVIDKRRSPRGGRTVEDLGYIDTLKKRKSLDKERIQYWLSKGAQPSATIHNLLVSEKIIDAKKIHVSKLSKKKQAEISATAKAKADEDAAKAKVSADNKTAGEVASVPAEISAQPAEVAEDQTEKETPQEEPKPTE